MAGLEVKFSSAAAMPFHRMKVRLKKEIVTMGVEDIDPLSDAGAYVEPDDWNALIADPDTVVIDTRNDYEVALGAFRDAVDPARRRFREFPGLGGQQPRRARRPQDRDVSAPAAYAARRRPPMSARSAWRRSFTSRAAS